MGIVTVTFNDSTHRLVPVEPTPEMLAAFSGAAAKWLVGLGDDADVCRAMLAAAPAVQLAPSDQPKQPLGDPAGAVGPLGLRPEPSTSRPDGSVPIASTGVRCAKPSLSCPNMKDRENDTSMSYEHYDCKVCGGHIALDYDEMR